jgi:putative transposase
MYQASDDGNHKESLKPSEPLVDKGATTLKKSKKHQDNPNRAAAVLPCREPASRHQHRQLSLFAMREYQLIESATILSDKLNSFVQDFQTRNFYQILAPGLILGGENSYAFWTEFSQAMSNALWLPTQTDLCGSDLSWFSGCVNAQDANSWFSMSVNSAQNKNSLQICCPSSTVSVAGFTDCESTKNKSLKRYKKTARHAHAKNQTKLPPNSVLKIRVYPSPELHKVWKQWLAAYRWVFNWAASKLKNGFEGDLQKAYRASDSVPEWVRVLPGHQAQEACDEAFDAYRQAKRNGGEARFKSCRTRSQTIQFKPGNYKRGTWYPKTTKGLTFKAVTPMPTECIYGTELVYQRGKWFACIPERVEETPTSNSGVIALDPGNRAFFTGYDGTSVLEIGQGDIGRINRLCSHLDKLLSRAALSPSKRQRHTMRKAANRMRERTRCLVKDLHNKVASMLVRNYKAIFLPTYQTSQMVVRSARKINRKSVRNMLTWSHAKFASHLEQMARRNGVLVIRCNESYTSKTCTNCGFIHHKLGGSKVFNCPSCGIRIPRDVNGARNIMLRALQATAFTIAGDAVLTLNAAV